LQDSSARRFIEIVHPPFCQIVIYRREFVCCTHTESRLEVNLRQITLPLIGRRGPKINQTASKVSPKVILCGNVHAFLKNRD
jgi:hypothetical protein